MSAITDSSTIADSSTSIPPAQAALSAPQGRRMIDPRGHRFGAGLSVVILGISFAANAPILVALVWLALGVSALFGTRYSALGRPWPIIRTLLRAGPPAELESEYPPRFAQALGSAVLTLAIALFAVGATPWAWLPVAAVAGLQTLLAATGYCLGCRLYFLRWWLPAAFDRLTRRTTFAR